MRQIVPRWLSDPAAAASLPAPVAADPDAADLSELKNSGLFDAAWYLEHYPDVAAAGVDPAFHYLKAGADEGRSPGPRFDILWYYGECPEASAPGVNPILHYLRHGRAVGRTPLALSPGQAFDSFSLASRSGALPFANRVRAGIDHVHFPLDRSTTISETDGFPLPPIELAARIGSPTYAGFEEIGRGVKRTILRCLPAGFDFAGKRCLDFGCGIGRVIRQFGREGRESEFWGCDIDGPSIRWAVENLAPPFRFYRLSQTAALPFEDSSFDLIYAISVFTQIYEDWHQIAMDLRRILKPGGLLVMSHTGRTPFEDNILQPFETNRGMYLKNPFNTWSAGGPLVFLTPEWVQRYWGNLFDISFIAPDALLDCETLCVMTKPPAGAPPRTEAPVLELTSTQPFNPIARGKILERCDLARPLAESYGIEASGETTIDGWLASGFTPGRVDVTVDGAPLPSRTAWGGPGPFRDRAEMAMRSFRTEVDLAAIPPGRYRLALYVEGQEGGSHEMSIPLLVGPPR